MPPLLPTATPAKQVKEQPKWPHSAARNVGQLRARPPRPPVVWGWLRSRTLGAIVFSTAGRVRIPETNADGDFDENSNCTC